ncbi:MAG TPA: hypothetical protein VFV30_11270 [Novosphingobium sp.]|nr:hypothetical protein [Novosphingobium sp.]
MRLVPRFFAGLRKAHWALRSAAFRTYLRLAYPGVRCHRSVIFGKGVTVRAFDGARLEIGEGTVVLEHAWIQVEGGSLTIGRNCLIGRAAVVVCSEAIEIGDGTLTAEHVTIRDQDHNYAGEGRLETQGSSTAAIRIGHDVWLAAKVTVTRGVEIAPHAVVGANAVVTRSLPVRGVYAGAPARLVKPVEAAAVEPDAQRR